MNDQKAKADEVGNVVVRCDMSKVANLLKDLINRQCSPGFVWYANVGDMPTMIEVNYAIEILERMEPKEVVITK